jgi:glycerophosphoryl diester phosphodiesterase
VSTPGILLNEVAGQIRHHHRPLLAFHIYFAVLALVTLTPASAWLLGGLVAASGQPMVGNEDLLVFLLHPAGFLWLVIHRLPALLELAVTQVAVHLLLAAPGLLLLGGSFVWLLGDYDPYYVIHEHPGELWRFLGIALLVGVLLVLLNGNLYLRWALALPALLSEGLNPRSALARSLSLTAGVRYESPPR